MMGKKILGKAAVVAVLATGVGVLGTASASASLGPGDGGGSGRVYGGNYASAWDCTVAYWLSDYSNHECDSNSDMGTYTLWLW